MLCDDIRAQTVVLEYMLTELQRVKCVGIIPYCILDGAGDKHQVFVEKFSDGSIGPIQYAATTLPLDGGTFTDCCA